MILHKLILLGSWPPSLDGPLAGLLVRLIQLLPPRRGQPILDQLRHRVIYSRYSIVCTDMSAVIRWTEIGCSAFVELISDLVMPRGLSKEAGRAGSVFGANGFAVPARAFRVDGSIHLLILLRRPFEGAGKRFLLHLVIVIDETVKRHLQGVRIVFLWAELMRVPCEVDVQGWNCHFSRIGCHDAEKAIILDKQTLHSGKGCWAVQPVDLVHLINKYPLSRDSSSELQGEE